MSLNSLSLIDQSLCDCLQLIACSIVTNVYLLFVN